MMLLSIRLPVRTSGGKDLRVDDNGFGDELPKASRWNSSSDYQAYRLCVRRGKFKVLRGMESSEGWLPPIQALW